MDDIKKEHVINFASRNSKNASKLKTTEFPETNGLPHGTSQNVDKEIDVSKIPIVTPANEVKNSNLVIEDAINLFPYFFSEPKSRDGKIQFSENRIITFYDDEEVVNLVRKSERSDNTTITKSILKPGPIFIHTPKYSGMNEFSYLGDNNEEKTDELSFSGQDVDTVLRRLFTLHDIPLEELKRDILTSLQRLSLGVIESFKQREQCYKYVGRQQCIEEVYEFKSTNERLKGEISSLTKDLNSERIKWEVVDETFAENDLLREEAEKLKLTEEQLTKELQLMPKWEDVDGLLEEDKELKLKINRIIASNEDLQKRYNEVQNMSESHLDEIKELSGLVSKYKKNNSELISSKEKVELQLKETIVRWEKTSKEVEDLRRDKTQLTARLNTVEDGTRIANEFLSKEKVYLDEESKSELSQIAMKPEVTTEGIERTNRLIKGYEGKNVDSAIFYGKLFQNTEQFVAQLNTNKAKDVDLVSVNDKLAFKLDDMKRNIEFLTSQYIGMTKKVKLMKKKVYNRYFDQNITLTSKNAELSKQLEQALIKLEQLYTLQRNYRELVSKNDTFTTEVKELVAMNTTLSKKVELESRKAQKFEMDLIGDQKTIQKFEFNLTQVKQWYEALLSEKREANAKVGQLENCYQNKILESVKINHELNEIKEISLERLQKIGQLNNRIKTDEQLLQNAERWQKEKEACVENVNSLRNENIGLLEKLSALESEISKIQKENTDLNDYRGDYASFDEKYEWLESIALSYKQEKESGERQIKDLQRQLKRTKKMFQSMGKLNEQDKEGPGKLHTRLDQLQAENCELCQRLNDKEDELQVYLNHLQEMTIMLRGTITLSGTLSPSDDITFIEPNTTASNTFRNISHLKWWRAGTQENRISRSLSRSVV